MKKIMIIYLVSLSIVAFSLIMIFQISNIDTELEKTTEFVENTLDIKNLQYAELSEITNGLIQPVGNQDFEVTIVGGTKHGNTLTISGTVPTPHSSITGMIYRGQGPSLAIVTIFQLTADQDGNYTHDVIINDDYMWIQEGEYTISVQNEGIYKEVKFHRQGNFLTN